MKLSGKELIAAIELEGIDVQMIGEGPFGSRWSSYFSKNKVLGKFFSSYGFSPDVNQPTILVLDPEDKWTLLHEYLHALFVNQRHQTNPHADAQVFENHQNTREAFLELYPKRNDPRFKSELIQVFEQYVELEIQVSLSLSIEEIVIEAMLLRAFNNSRDLGFTQAQAHTAQKYIELNSKVILSYLEQFQQIAVEIQASEKTHLQILNLREEILEVTRVPQH